MKKRPVVRLILTVLLAVEVSGVGFTNPVEASHTGPCLPTPITSPEVSAMVTTPASLVVPNRVKECVQSTYNTGGLDNISATWLSPDAFNVPASTTVLNATLSVANVSFNNSPVSSVNVTVDVLDSKVDWPAQDGFYDASNVMNFSPGGTVFAFGSINRGTSKGLSSAVTINTSKLRPGRNVITVFLRGTWVYGPSVSCSPATPVPGTCVDTFEENVIVDFNPIPPIPNFNIQPYFSGGGAPPSAPVSGGTIQAGQTYDLGVHVINTGAGPSQDVYLDVPLPTSDVVDPGADPAPGQVQGNFVTGIGYNSSCGPVATPRCILPHWSWRSLAPLPPLSPLDGQLRFTVKSTALDGDNVCFDAYAYHVNSAHVPPFASNQICWTVVNPRYPFLTTSGGDVHTGGSIGVGVSCPTTSPSGGSFSGSSAQATNVTYVISAGGNINNVLAGTYLGNTPTLGGYGTVCRPNLEQAAQAYIAKNGSTPYATLSGVATGTMLTAISGSCTVVNANTINSQITLFVQGDVCIDGNIQYNTAGVSRANLPAFGLIATGQIRIKSNVTRLDGYYYAKDKIDTCYDVDITVNANGCQNNLTVAGLMMAKNFRFARTGSSGGAPVASETVNALGDLYFAPPPAFDGSFSPRAARPRYEGERPPLF